MVIAIDETTVACLSALSSGRSFDSEEFAPEDTRLANARLIAAAPELLEVLRSFGVLACTPEWEAKRQAAISRATTP